MAFLVTVMESYVNSSPHVVYNPPAKSGLSLPATIIGIICVILVCVTFMFVFSGLVMLWQRLWQRRMEIMTGKEMPNKTLTPTEKFILAASSPTIGNNYKCVIDIWDTHTSEREVAKVIKLFEWGWGEFTYENTKNMVDHCLNCGHNMKYKEYCNADVSSPDFASKYTDFELQLLKKMKQQYPKQGMLAWDLVRVLSVVGGAYMGGIMKYSEAAQIALETCRLLQRNFSSWDDMVGSYTLGYQFWRGKKKTDRLKYYKKLKRTWIYKISWSTPLKENELETPTR